MKKILILIVLAAVFLHFYPQPEVTNWYQTQKDKLVEMFSDATDTKVKVKADRIYQDLKPKFNQFRPSEIEHLKQITSSRRTVKNYYQEFCHNKRDGTLHANNQALICQTIGNYTSLL